MKQEFVLNRLQAYTYALHNIKTEYTIIEEYVGVDVTLYIFEDLSASIRSAALGYNSGSVMVLPDWSSKYPKTLNDIYYCEWIDIDNKIWEINNIKNK